MRTIYDQNGNNVTSTVQAALQAGRTFRVANLYSFANRVFWRTSSGELAFWGFTDADIPIGQTFLQLFSSGSTPVAGQGGGIVTFPLGSGTNIFPNSPVIGATDYPVTFGTSSINISVLTQPFPNVPHSGSGVFQHFNAGPGSGITSIDLVVVGDHFGGSSGSAFYGYTVTETSLPTTLANGPIGGPFHFGPFVDIYRVSPSGAYPNPNTFPFTACQFSASMATNIAGPYGDSSTTTAYFVLNGGFGGGGAGGVGALPFVPEVIKRDKLTYGVGLEANNITITWNIDDTKNYFGSYSPLISPPVSQLSMKQAMSIYRAFDDCPFWIHQVLIPDNPTPSSSFYTTLVYRGFIRKIESSTEYVKITVNSLMQILQDLRVPTQILGPGNRDVQFLGIGTPDSTTLVTPITAINSVVFTMMTGVTIKENQLQDCWLTFFSAGSSPTNGLPSNGMPGWKIQSNTAATVGTLTTITFYDPPIIPGSPPVINLFTQNSGSVPGFDVPPPEPSL